MEPFLVEGGFRPGGSIDPPPPQLQTRLPYPVQASGAAMLPEAAPRFKEVTVHPP